MKRYILQRKRKVQRVIRKVTSDKNYLAPGSLSKKGKLVERGELGIPAPAEFFYSTRGGPYSWRFLGFVCGSAKQHIFATRLSESSYGVL